MVLIKIATKRRVKFIVHRTERPLAGAMLSFKAGVSDGCFLAGNGSCEYPPTFSLNVRIFRAPSVHCPTLTSAATQKYSAF